MGKQPFATVFLFIASCLFLTPWAAISSETEKKIERPVRQSIDTRQKTQKARAQWRDDRKALESRYEQLEMENKYLEQQVGELKSRAEASKNRIAAKEKQLADIEQMSKQIDPFLKGLMVELEAGLTTGNPFLMGERKLRIEKLKAQTDDPGVPVSEKYRKVMEALLIEAEYGFTIETYQESIPIAGQALLANIFRLGRISLFYQSLDQRQSGFYNVATGQWEPLPPSDNHAIRSAIDIAAKRKPAEILTMPVGRLVPQ